MAIPDYARTNFETLLKAAEAGDLALMECTEVASGETRYVLCAVGRDDEGVAVDADRHARRVELLRGRVGLRAVRRARTRARSRRCRVLTGVTG